MLLFADLFLFLSLYPRLLRLLLLPYTTLFRSAVGWLVRVVAVVVGLVGQATHRHRLRQHVVQRAVVGQRLVGDAVGGGAVAGRAADPYGAVDRARPRSLATGDGHVVVSRRADRRVSDRVVVRVVFRRRRRRVDLYGVSLHDALPIWLVRVVAVVVGLVGQATHRHRLRQHVVQRAVVGQRLVGDAV